MAIIRVEKNKDYTIMSNYHLKDKNLTLEEKGLLSVFYALAENWEYSVRGLARLFGLGKNKVNDLLKSLRSKNYIEMKKTKNEKGHFKWIYTIYEVPRIINTPVPLIRDADFEDGNKVLSNKLLSTNNILSLYQDNSIPTTELLTPDKIRDKTTLFTYFIQIDKKNFDKYTKLYFNLKINNKNHDIYRIFSYVFNKIEEIGRINIQNLYSYIEYSVHTNIQKLNILENIDNLWGDDDVN